MLFNYHSVVNEENSPIATMGHYVARYRTALYVVFAAAVSLSVVWNWNWLTGAEVFRVLAALPCTFMMLMCLKRAGCRSAPEERVNQR